MSWLNQNYEKAALGGAAVVALGLAFWGWSKVGGVEDDFTAEVRGTGNNDPAVAEGDLVAQAQASLAMPRDWAQGDAEGRPVDLFTGIPLFVGSDNPNVGIDPITADPIHDPIPNTWWIQYRLDPGFGDSPARDPDQDGFSNLEEFQAKTDPTDPKAHPALIAKLKYVTDDSLVWLLEPGYGSEDGSFPIKYRDGENRKNAAGAGDMVAPGELFFSADPMKNRFKLLGSEVRRELNPRTNSEVTVTYTRIEDQRANKKGTIYEIPSPFPRGRDEEFAQYDRTAVLSLEAIGLAGQEFRVEENTRFSLPPKAGGEDFLVKTVTPESITVEYAGEGGTVQTVEIPKGGMPQIAE